jgi:hypothetical protein
VCAASSVHRSAGPRVSTLAMLAQDTGFQARRRDGNKPIVSRRMSNLPFAGAHRGSHCPVHLQEQISPIIPTVFLVKQTGMFVVCSWCYCNTGSVESHVKSDIALRRSVQRYPKNYRNAVFSGTRAISSNIPRGKIRGKPGYPTFIPLSLGLLPPPPSSPRNGSPANDARPLLAPSPLQKLYVLQYPVFKQSKVSASSRPEGDG